ncbi:MAG: DUF6046 domain-containing protein [Urechidicola sp.]|nr:DUF6046 domain-containing protein [Urechidicola sp.]
MTLVTLQLSHRYQAAFGRVAGAIKPNAVGLSKTDKGYDLEYYDYDTDDFEQTSFKFGINQINFGSTTLLAGQKVNDNIFAPPPLISFARDKSHVETEINGTDTQVVERWGTKPWNIRMRGLLIDIENRTYPTDKIDALNTLFEYNKVVSVYGTQFFDKSISDIYFKSIEINGVQGFEDTIQYTLTARSIKPVAFTLLNPSQ